MYKELLTKKNILAFLGLLLVAVALPVVTLLVQRSQEMRKQAVGCSAGATSTIQFFNTLNGHAITGANQGDFIEARVNLDGNIDAADIVISYKPAQLRITDAGGGTDFANPDADGWARWLFTKKRVYGGATAVSGRMASILFEVMTSVSAPANIVYGGRTTIAFNGSAGGAECGTVATLNLNGATATPTVPAGVIPTIPATCGNGVLDAGEVCDKAKNCVTGEDGGQGCTTSCAGGYPSNGRYNYCKDDCSGYADGFACFDGCTSDPAAAISRWGGVGGVVVGEACPAAVGGFMNASCQCVASLPRAAECVSYNLPTTMTTGETKNIQLVIRNLGTEAWTSAAGYKLGQYYDNASIWGTARINLGADVAPNATKTFNFTITAPMTTGTYNNRWQMLKEGTEWFGGLCGGDTVVTQGNCCGYSSALEEWGCYANCQGYASSTTPYPARSCQNAANCYALASGTPVPTATQPAAGSGNFSLGNNGSAAVTGTFSTDVFFNSRGVSTKNFQVAFHFDGTKIKVLSVGSTDTHLRGDKNDTGSNGYVLLRTKEGNTSTKVYGTAGGAAEKIGTITFQFQGTNKQANVTFDGGGSWIMNSVGDVAVTAAAPNYCYFMTGGTCGAAATPTLPSATSTPVSTNTPVPTLTPFPTVDPSYGFNALYISDTLPLTVNSGQTFTATVTMRNNGLVTGGVEPFWSGGPTGDGLSSVPAGSTVWGSSGIKIVAGTLVHPNSINPDYTFSLTLTAPTVATTTAVDCVWGMMRGTGALFGQQGGKRITVVAAATPTPTGIACPRGAFGNLDCSADGKIDTADLTILLSSWGLAPAPTAGHRSADLAGNDGRVDTSDLTVLLRNWGTGQ